MGKHGIASLAWEAATSERTRVFRMLSRERGLTARTRPGIEAEANAFARVARERVYLDAGYAHCANPLCGQLASPGWADCPNCAPIR